MNLQDLKQRPFATTLMGVVQAVARYHEYDYTPSWLYGATGHAFLVNVHETLCPSSPYCWNREPFMRLMGNLGIRMSSLGFYSERSPAPERAAVEKRIRELLDAGIACSLLNMENQVITGYDATGFLLTCPFPQAPETVTPAHMAFGSWQPFDEFHFDFFSFEKSAPASRRTMVRESLDYAIALYDHPADFTDEPYAAGPRAYDNWVKAVAEGHGGEHGAWYNATVWAECRMMAARYLGEIAEDFPDLAEQIANLGRLYARVSTKLTAAGDQQMDAAEKIALLQEIASLEAQGIDQIGALLPGLAA